LVFFPAHVLGEEKREKGGKKKKKKKGGLDSGVRPFPKRVFLFRRENSYTFCKEKGRRWGKKLLKSCRRFALKNQTQPYQKKGKEGEKRRKSGDATGLIPSLNIQQF